MAQPRWLRAPTAQSEELTQFLWDSDTLSSEVNSWECDVLQVKFFKSSGNNLRPSVSALGFPVSQAGLKCVMKPRMTLDLRSSNFLNIGVTRVCHQVQVFKMPTEPRASWILGKYSINHVTSPDQFLLKKINLSCVSKCMEVRRYLRESVLSAYYVLGTELKCQDCQQALLLPGHLAGLELTR